MASSSCISIRGFAMSRSSMRPLAGGPVLCASACPLPATVPGPFSGAAWRQASPDASGTLRARIGADTLHLPLVSGTAALPIGAAGTNSEGPYHPSGKCSFSGTTGASSGRMRPSWFPAARRNGPHCRPHDRRGRGPSPALRFRLPRRGQSACPHPGLAQPVSTLLLARGPAAARHGAAAERDVKVFHIHPLKEVKRLHI